MQAKLRKLMGQTNMLHFEGEEQYLDAIVEALETERPLGVVDEADALYERLTVAEYLNYFADLLDARALLPSAIEQMHLADLRRKKIARCSRGEKRRIAIARELLKDAAAYVLVDPLEEIDEESRKRILTWMDSFHGYERRLVTLSRSHRYTYLCPGDHYEIIGEELVCIDENEVSEENPDLPSINKISVTYQEKNFLFNPEEIDYIEANDGQVFVYVQREQYAGAFRMGELEERLGKFGFFRCHRSYIVNMQKVRELVKWTRNSYSLKLAGYPKTDIPLSKAKISELKSMYEF